MENRIKEVLSVLVIVMVFVFVSTAYAADHDALTALLIDLKGWTADKAEGMSMDMGGMKMINANRSYTKGEQKIYAEVMVGSKAMAYDQMRDMKFESSDSRVEVKEIDGFKAKVVYDKNAKSSTVIVSLTQSQTSSAVFTISCKGLSEEKAFEIAKKFNWNKMKASVAKLLY